MSFLLGHLPVEVQNTTECVGSYSGIFFLSLSLFGLGILCSFQRIAVMKRVVPQTDEAAWTLIVTQEEIQIVWLICLKNLYECHMAAHSSPLRAMVK